MLVRPVKDISSMDFSQYSEIYFNGQALLNINIINGIL
jgi:hypothetical protein